MNVLTAPLMAAVLAIAPLAAHANDTVAQLAQETGLSERNVRMVLGARTPYAEYRIVYNRVQRQFKEAVGESNYDRLMRGESIVIERAPSQDNLARQVRKQASNQSTRSEDREG